VKFKIIKEEKHPNVIKLTIEAKVNGKIVSERFGFSHSQIENESYKKTIKKWIQQQTDDTTKLKSLKGKEINI